MDNKRTPGMFGGYYNEDGKLEDYTPSYKFEPNHNWSIDSNPDNIHKKREDIFKQYSMINHAGGVILSGIILFVLFEIYSAISYLFDLIKQSIIG